MQSTLKQHFGGTEENVSTASIRLHNPSEAMALFGENDKHLKRLRERLEARILARGDSVRLEGNKAAVELAESLLRDLLSLYRQGGDLGIEDVERGLELALNGERLHTEEASPMNLGGLELPKRLRPKTKGQQRYVEAINASDITFGIGPAGTGKCVVGETLVLTQCGIVPISSLAEGVELEEQRRKPVRIFGLDGLEWASHVYNGGLQKTIRIRTRHGFVIEGTAEHPLLTLNTNGEPEWIRMDQITPKTVLALTRGSELWGQETRVHFEYHKNPKDHSSQSIYLEEIDTDFAYFMGLIVGDGCMTRPTMVLFSNRDAQLRQFFTDMATRFGFKVSNHGSDIRINSIQFASLLKHLGVTSHKAHEKPMPYSILRAPREQVVAFLQGLFDTDGHASKREGYPSLCSSSQKLIEAVQICLLNLGIVSKVWRKKTTHKDTFILEMRGTDAKLFYEKVGFRLSRKQERAANLSQTQNTNLDVLPNLASSIDQIIKAQPLTHQLHKWFHDYRTGRRRPSYAKLQQIVSACTTQNLTKTRLEWLLERQLLWSEVQEIEYGESQVYDLTVPQTHSFTANGFVSHNSYIAVAMAVAAFKAKKVKRIILTRPAVEAGEKLGFLPGDLQAKVDPYLRPLYDALFDMIDAERFESYLSSGSIEVAPLGFMRGRAQPLSSKILTPIGWRMMGELEVGDFVIGQNGEATQVLGVYPQGQKEVFRITMTDGSSTVCCAEHLWHVYTQKDRQHKKDGRVLELREIQPTLRQAHQYRYEIPMMQAVKFPAQPTTLDPYALGLLLGDGCITGKTTPTFSSGDPELVQALEAVLPKIELVYKSGVDYVLRHTEGGRGGLRIPNPVTVQLRELGLDGTNSSSKFIPDNYKFNTPEIRLAVLQGLMDTDGGPVTQQGRTCRVQYTTTSQRLRDDVMFLVRSLGGVAYVRTRAAAGRKPGLARGREVPYRNDAYVMDIRLPEHLAPFRLTRKLEKIKQHGAGRPMRHIKSVESLGMEATQCIRVAASDHLYVTDDFIVTHNTLNDAFIILDEAQNTTPEQMKMFLTRMGFSSKVVVTGDITQVDLPRHQKSGLTEAQRILKNIDGIEFVYFNESDVVRHPLVGKIIRAYDSGQEVQDAKNSGLEGR